MKPLFLAAIMLGFIVNVDAQLENKYSSDPALPHWASLMYVEHPDWGAVMDAFHLYYESHSFEKNSHTQYLKRMLREQETYHYQFTDPRLDEDAQSRLRDQERVYQQNYDQQSAARNGWTSLGPWDWDHDAAARSYAPGAAHVYTIEQCSANGSVLYAGTATAGLWKSTNGGGSWTNVTKDLMVNYVYAVEMNPGDCNEVFASMMNGIYKSTDGGSNWAQTGNASFQSLSLDVKDIKFLPGSNSILFAATNNGFYRSSNNGGDWTQIMSGAFQEIEFHPGNSAIVYTILQSGDLTRFYKSTDSGLSFTHQPSGWPVPAAGAENKRAEIAVTPAAPDKVYALLTGAINGGSGLYGVYVSSDAGQSWSFNCCGPQPGGPASVDNINMMGWSDIGTDNGGQYYYDLALAVSPTDANKVFVGGVNLWVSEDGGSTFTCPAKWSHPHKANYVHADIHDINFYPSGDLWVANDGGIFHSTDNGNSFNRSIYGISGSDFWGFGVGFNNDELMVGGAYHNGTLLKNGNVYINDWICTDGGDGVGGAVNPILDDQVYSNYNIKTMSSSRTQSPATRGYALQPSWTYITGQFSQIEFAGDNYSVHYFGNGNSLYKTEDDNRTVSALHDFGEEVTDVEVSWTNPQVMYVATWPGYWSRKKLYRSSNGGISWTEITPSGNVFSSGLDIPFDVEVSYEDENRIWLARVGRQSGDQRKVFRSDDGGQTWTNITNAALSGEVLTNIISQRGSNDDLYLGTTRTVYHANGGGSNWTLFSTGLPASTRSRQLAISYRNNKLINASNRSVWITDLAQNSSIQAQIAVDKYYSGCARDTFKFADHSTAPENSSFQWSFPGASWVSSTTSRNPKVVYGQSGTYNVSLSVGGNTQTLNDFIEVGDGCSPDPFAGNALESVNSRQHFLSDNSLNISSNTMTLMAWVKPDGIQDGYTGIIFTDGDAAGLNFRNNNEIGYHWPGGSTHWAWSSGLYAPADEWSFVAMVITPNDVTFYLNEQKVVRNFGSPISLSNWQRFRVGSYAGWGSRNFKGLIDEAIIWNRALSQDEIRDWRHLTKHKQATASDPLYDQDMLVYLQFNESGEKIFDRKGANHGTLSGDAQLVNSTVPIGDGSSHRLMVNSGGSYNFSDEQLSLTFPAAGPYPDEELVVTRLTNAPTDLPANAFHSNHYWIVNNYGNANFNELEELSFQGLSGINGTMTANPEIFTLNKRPSNADGSNWGAFIDQADAAQTNGTVRFNAGNGVTSFSQFVIGQDFGLLPVDFVDLELENKMPDGVSIKWETAMEENLDHFIVQRSRDGRNFESIDQLVATNNRTGSHYQLLDKLPYKGQNYYRIKAVDFDGSLDYSPVRNIRLDKGQAWATVAPNPLGSTGLKLETSFKGLSTFELYDASGRLLRRTAFEAAAYLRMPELAAGIYSYRIINGTEMINGQLVKK